MPRPARTGQHGNAVLIVDDNPVARSTAVNLFVDLGYQVFDTYNGAEALRLLGAHPGIGLLFLDVRMPGMTGVEVAEAAHRIRPNVKVVFTSGYSDRRGVPDGACFVPKPWRLDQIADAIRTTAP